MIFKAPNLVRTSYFSGNLEEEKETNFLSKFFLVMVNNKIACLVPINEALQEHTAWYLSQTDLYETLQEHTAWYLSQTDLYETLQEHTAWYLNKTGPHETTIRLCIRVF